MQPADQCVVPGPLRSRLFFSLFETRYNLLIGCLPRASPAQTAGSMHTARRSKSARFTAADVNLAPGSESTMMPRKNSRLSWLLPRASPEASGVDGTRQEARVCFGSSRSPGPVPSRCPETADIAAKLGFGTREQSKSPTIFGQSLRT
ncbi:hypothetical protein CP533_2796 [Ophiocordyceps camponoti-saundersi (nom. inval.)]|nr:hypothetical protein CP533_2796 [Ophiocordyceps camponoti-saundersi (nom. inval.)]